MDAPRSDLFDSLPKETRRDLVLGRISSFVHKGKTYNLTDGKVDITRTMEEIEKLILIYTMEDKEIKLFEFLEKYGTPQNILICNNVLTFNLLNPVLDTPRQGLSNFRRN